MNHPPPPILVEVEPRPVANALLRRIGAPDLDSTAAGATTAPFRPGSVVLSAAQRRAVARAIGIVDRRGGVLLADRTGAGKTFLAIALIEYALAHGHRNILVTGPAAIATQWHPLLLRASSAHGATFHRRTGPAGTRGNASGTAGPGRPTVSWVSHALVSLGRWPDHCRECDFVVVDEAHAFRNPSTRRYGGLAWLCRNAQVVLLTATPVNNSLLDLYFLFRLFLGDGALHDLGVPDLFGAFRAAAEAGGPVRAPLDAAIDSLTVRTPHRADSGAGSRTARPARVRPVPVRYDPTVTANGVRDAIDAIRRLKLEAYLVSGRGRPRAGAELLRFGLAKRLESSLVAFTSSAHSVARFLDSFADAARAGYWLSPIAHRTFNATCPDQILLAPLALPRLPAAFDQARLIASARSDAALLRAVARRLTGGECPRDGKLDTLIALLEGPLRDRRVLVFTEFRDTAVHLWKSIRLRCRCALIHGSRAMLGDRPAARRDVVQRFAPISNGGKGETIERVDVLIATDVLAEGFNLQDAADVVSYDLPWNPVRLIQRVGRIDRSGSPHEEVRCHNFLPDRTLDLFLGLVDRIGAKLETIRAGPGRGSLERTFESGGALSHAEAAGRAGHPTDASTPRPAHPDSRRPARGSEPAGVGGLSAPAYRPDRPGNPDRRSYTGPASPYRIDYGRASLFANIPRAADEPSRPGPESGARGSRERAAGIGSRWSPAGSRTGSTEHIRARAPASTGLIRRLGCTDPGLFDEFASAADPTAGLGVTDNLRSVTRGPDQSRSWLVALTPGPGVVRLLAVSPANGRPRVREDPLRSIELLRQVVSGMLPVRAFEPALQRSVALAPASEARCLAAVAAAIAAVDHLVELPVPGARRTAGLVRQLLSVVARQPGQPDAALLQRVDRIASALRAGVPVGVERAMATALAEAWSRPGNGPRAVERLIDELETLVGDPAARTRVSRRDGARLTPDGAKSATAGDGGVSPARRRPARTAAPIRPDSGRPRVALVLELGGLP